jgi:hypothetical protein
LYPSKHDRLKLADFPVIHVRQPVLATVAVMVILGIDVATRVEVP